MFNIYLYPYLVWNFQNQYTFYLPDMFIEILYLPSTNWYSKMDSSTQHWDKSSI